MKPEELQKSVDTKAVIIQKFLIAHGLSSDQSLQVLKNLKIWWDLVLQRARKKKQIRSRTLARDPTQARFWLEWD